MHGFAQLIQYLQLLPEVFSSTVLWLSTLTKKNVLQESQGECSSDICGQSYALSLFTLCSKQHWRHFRCPLQDNYSMVLSPKNMYRSRREGNQLSSLIEPIFALESRNKDDSALSAECTVLYTVQCAVYCTLIENNRWKFIFQWIFVDGVEWNSYFIKLSTIFDFQSTPSKNIHGHFNFFLTVKLCILKCIPG